MQETNNKKMYIWGAIVAVIVIVLGFTYLSNNDEKINNNTNEGDTINNATSTATSTKNNPEKPNFDYKG